MATRKLTTEDFTLAPQAATEADVNGQDARTRLWQSLNYTYGNQLRKSNESYDKAFSQANNEMLKRGMQRSSYGAQTGANILNKKIEAQNDIGDALIADYQNRINQIEQQEKEDDRWERQFAAGREDAAWNKEFQQNQFEYGKERDLVADDQWKQQFDYTKGRDEIGDQQWQKQFDEDTRRWNLNYNLQSAAASGSGGGGGGYGGDGSSVGNPASTYSTQGLNEGLAAADVATALAAKAKQIQSAPGNKIQIDQYQRQIKALQSKLSTAQSDAERTSYRNQITALQQKINSLK